MRRATPLYFNRLLDRAIRQAHVKLEKSCGRSSRATVDDLCRGEQIREALFWCCRDHGKRNGSGRHKCKPRSKAEVVEPVHGSRSA